MRKLIPLTVLALFVLMTRCDWVAHECNFDRDCDDGNPCTEGGCELEWSNNPDPGWCNLAYVGRCEYSELSGSCHINGEKGMCVGGECRLEGEAPDGGVEVLP